ncbi:MAG: hypothetical protein LBI99_06830, partial [Propionibacteriaceae bacterium]|nr:hypothetical protein [Propionibacteriaceae bacterium]
MRFDDDVKWQAVIDCNPDFDGLFYYVVKTVGVCCRPSCRSRTPKRENVVYFDTLADAEAAGYRPCRRCRPDQADTDPMDGIIWQARDLIDTHYGQRQLLAERMRELGVSSGQLAKVYRDRVGCAPGEYLTRERARHARELQDAGTPNTDVAFALG